MPHKVWFPRWLFAFMATVAAVVVCVAYVDRPLAEFLEQHFRHSNAWVWVKYALAPCDLAVVATLLFLLGCGVWALTGRPLPSWTKTPVLCSWAAMWATAADIIFKRIFGRAWPDPTYIQDHLYGFDWLHGRPHWESFPSATAAISAAIIGVLWTQVPRFRPIGVLIVVLLCAAVVVNNFHWLGDVVAGAFLGASIGLTTVLLQSR